MTQVQSKRSMVALAHRQLFEQHDTRALDRYFWPDFVDHSPRLKNGLSGVRERLKNHPDLRHQSHRILADGDLVALHGRYTGLIGQPLVGFDIYRVADGLIIEHWDGLVPESPPNASGRSQLDGPVTPGTDHDPEHNRAFITEYFTKTLIDGDYDGFRRYTDGRHFLQHSPGIADGVEEVIAFLDALKGQGKGLEYERIHRSIADGQFVLTQSEGRIAGQRHAYFELWRVENGKLAEMWDAIAPVPEDKDAGHNFGIF